MLDIIDGRQDQVVEDVRLGVIVSRFNEPVTGALLDGALTQASESGLDEEQLTVVHVPGAVEIPLVAKQLAKSGHFDAIVCLGAVIKGETAHFEYVCDIVTRGVSQIMLDYEIPVTFNVITAYNGEQARARCDGTHSHMGKSAITTALEMVNVTAQIHQI